MKRKLAGNIKNGKKLHFRDLTAIARKEAKHFTKHPFNSIYFFF